MLTPLLCVSLIELRLFIAARGAIFHDIGAVPSRRVAIVFGAQVLPDRRLSVALANRVDAGIALYRAGKVAQLLMTGDSREEDYDETGAMRDYAVARGVPASAILLDPAGLRTYDSCYRAHNTFGIRDNEAILVTQEYHLPRAIYTCTGLGVRAIGFVAAPFGGPRGREAEGREHPARWLAWWQLNVSHPTPPTVR
ncbi:MAG TPA: ElyC/SanA/YdcF family protein [Thermomicrobiales bacterium]